MGSRSRSGAQSGSLDLKLDREEGFRSLAPRFPKAVAGLPEAREGTVSRLGLGQMREDARPIACLSCRVLQVVGDLKGEPELVGETNECPTPVLGIGSSRPDLLVSGVPPRKGRPSSEHASFARARARRPR